MSFQFFGTFITAFLMGIVVLAQTDSTERMTFEGTLTTQTGDPIDLSPPNELTFYIYSGSCYLYGETTMSAGDSQGNISHRIGNGTPVAGSLNSYSERVLNGAASGSLIANDSPCFVADDQPRMIQVYYAPQNISASFELGAVPYALVAKTLGGHESDDFVKVTSLSGGTTGQILSRDGSNGFMWVNPTTALTSSSIISSLGYTPLDKNGDIVLGNLNVSGSIRISNNSNSCLSNLAGALRFNAGNVEVCDGGGVWSYITGGVVANSIGSNEIADGSISNTDILSSTISYSKLNLSDGDIPLAKIANLTSLTTSTAAVISGDSLSSAIGKLQGQIDDRWVKSGSNLFYQNGNISIGTNVGSPHRLWATSNSNSFDSVAVFEQTGNAAVSSITPVLSISRRVPSGLTAENGFGSGLTFSADNASGALRPQAIIATRWISAVGASETSQIEFLTSGLNAAGASFLGTKMSLGSKGDLQVTGNIQAGGSIRVGGDGDPASTTCTGQEGKQRYNSVVKTMEYCDGANWQGMHGVTYCDPGYTMVGVSGTATAFCMHTALQPSSGYADFSTALADCKAQDVARNSVVQLCSLEQYDQACESNSMNVSVLSGTFSWTNRRGNNDDENAVVRYESNQPAGNVTCHITRGTTGDFGRITNSFPLNSNTNKYRCCYQ